MQFGMWQELQKDCMPPQSKWKISAKIRLLDMTGMGKDCNKLIIGGPTAYGKILFGRRRYVHTI